MSSLSGNLGNVLTVSDVSGTTAYAYDALYRVTDEVKSNVPGQADYSVESAYDLNELLTTTTEDKDVAYGYDANGSRTSKAVDEDGDGATDKLTEYAYDVNDRLLSADIDGATVFQATYDYRTRRLSKTESGETTYFRYDGGVSFQEWKAGVKQAEFVRGSGMGGGIGSILYSDRPADGGGVETEFFVYNAVGHTVALTDDDGYSDGEEMSAGTDPLDATSHPDAGGPLHGDGGGCGGSAAAGGLAVIAARGRKR